jgi:hypothetical protein
MYKIIIKLIPNISKIVRRFLIFLNEYKKIGLKFEEILQIKNLIRIFRFLY